jgi:hypothetical protein
MGDMNPKLTINFDASALEYLNQKFWKLFGKDESSRQLAGWFQGLQQTGLAQTETVQCVGMRTPLPFDNVYQPTRVIVGPDPDEMVEGDSYAWENQRSRSIIRGRALKENYISVQEFLKRDQDALIFGGPGWGKTTLLHHIYRLTLRDEFLLPVLIILRRPNAVGDLERYVEACSRIERRQGKACSLLLVDGYDEVDTSQRKRVSEALLQFTARGHGKFYLTCRDYYQISQLNAPEVRLGEFTRDDQVRFVRVFLSAFSATRQDSEVVVSQLEERGFDEFLSHPLLLTLACIVRTSSSSAQPRSAVRLLEYALDVLCFQWDEKKNIDRERTTPLAGHERVRILRQIAYRAKSPFVKAPRAEQITSQQLTMLDRDKVNPRQVLLEIARFYGILAPAEDGYEFVHRTIHDFLAAQQWVQSGEFLRPQQYEWNARTGYAACLIDDATDVLKQALAAPDGLPTVTEIIGNYATFADKKAVVEALIAHFSGEGGVLDYHRSTGSEAASRYSPHIRGQLKSDFLRLANSRLLDFIVEYCCERRSNVTDLLVAYSMCELYERKLKLSHQTYKRALAAYNSERFAFVVPSAMHPQLQFLNPVPQNWLKNYKASETTGNE